MDHAIVIDVNGYKIELVLVHSTEDGNIVLNYSFDDKTQKLIFHDISTALSMYRPRWDGKKWIETGSAPTSDIKLLKQQKIVEINATRASIINSGVEVNTSQGLKKFSLTDHDQMNLTAYYGALVAAIAGLPSPVNPEQGVWYHADGEKHRYWSPEDFYLICNTVFPFVAAQITYCKDLIEYVDSLTKESDIIAVKYGVTIV